MNIINNSIDVRGQSRWEHGTEERIRSAYYSAIHTNKPDEMARQDIYESGSLWMRLWCVTILSTLSLLPMYLFK